MSSLLTSNVPHAKVVLALGVIQISLAVGLIVVDIITFVTMGEDGFTYTLRASGFWAGILHISYALYGITATQTVCCNKPVPQEKRMLSTFAGAIVAILITLPLTIGFGVLLPLWSEVNEPTPGKPGQTVSRRDTTIYGLMAAHLAMNATLLVVCIAQAVASYLSWRKIPRAVATYRTVAPVNRTGVPPNFDEAVNVSVVASQPPPYQPYDAQPAGGTEQFFAKQDPAQKF